MLQNCPGLVLLDTLRHHIDDVMHDTGPQLQVEVTLHSLLGDSFSHSLAVSSLKLSRQNITRPSIQEWSLPSHEEVPHSPSRSQESTTWALTYRSCIEPVVNDMFLGLEHPDLLHQLVLVSVHACHLSH